MYDLLYYWYWMIMMVVVFVGLVVPVIETSGNSTSGCLALVGRARAVWARRAVVGLG